MFVSFSYRKKLHWGHKSIVKIYVYEEMDKKYL